MDTPWSRVGYEMIVSVTELDGEDVFVTVLGYDSVSATVIDDTRVR